MDFADEINAHIAIETDRLIAEGWTPLAAEQAARRAFGNIGMRREHFHESHRLLWLDHLQQDVRYATRRLCRTPWVTAVIVITLGLVMGANTTIFGLVNSIYLRRLALPRAEELVAVRPMNGGSPIIVTGPEFARVSRNPELPQMAAYFFEPFAVGTAGGTTPVYGDVVSPTYFDLLQIRPMLGRLLTATDEAESAPVAVVSHAFWRAHLGGDSDAAGKTLRINDHVFTVVGVTEPGFTGLYQAHALQVVIPLATAGALGMADLSMHYTDMIARVPAGKSRRHAAAQLQRAFMACCEQLPETGAGELAVPPPQIVVPGDGPTGDTRYSSTDHRWHVDLTDASRGLTWSSDLRGEYGDVLLSLLGAVALLTLLACANVATLLLARAAARRRELAVRASLGASRGRLVRQLLTESVILGLLGTVLGLVIARIATAQLVQHLPASAAPLHDIVAWRPDPAVFAFTAITMLACTLWFGLWPARRAARVDLRVHLDGSRSNRGPARRFGAEHLLVTGQVAIAMLLIAAGALFVATLRNLGGGRGGYPSAHIVLAEIRASGPAPMPELTPELHDRVIAATHRVPGVTGVAMAASAPIFPRWWSETLLLRPDEHGMRDRRFFTRIDAVDPGFFALSGVQLVAGRRFSAADDRHGEHVAIVSQSFVQRRLAGVDPIGLLLTSPADSVPMRIVGVVADARFGQPRDSVEPMVYLPINQEFHPPVSLTMIAKVNGDPAAMALTIARVVTTAVPGVIVSDATSIDGLLADVLARERLVALLGGLFGAAGLGLTALGLYGLLSFQTALRTKEIGVRMALGANRADTMWLVMRRGLALALAGLGAGIPLALGAAHLVRAQLYGIGAADPRVLAGSAAALMLTAVAASLLPARRAARVDPMTALRVDW